MDKEELIFTNVISKNHSGGSNCVESIVRIKNKIFNIESIYSIIEHIKWVNEKVERGSIKILIESTSIADQVIVLIFESIIYHVLNNMNISIKYRFNLQQNTIGYQCYKNSILYKYNNCKIIKEKYIKEYEKNIIIDKNHYRKRCIRSEDKSQLSITMDEIACFFKNLLLDEAYSEDLTEVIIEIIGNAVEHSKSSCISSINVLDSSGGKEKIIDVAIIDYSDIYLGTGMEKYLESDSKHLYNERNGIVLEAYNNHKEYFSDLYGLSDFAMISAFQKNVTSRINTPFTGGTGLTKLIKALIDKSTQNYCYVCSGETIIFFHRDFLNLTDDGLIGFNKENDYLNKIPNLEIVSKNSYNINVNAYNLQFIFKENERNE